jgi:hypothetical protein
VEKEHFLDLTKNYTSLTAEEARAVDELQQAYPYSQVVRCLASRAARDHQFANATGALAMSAVYSTDRTVLKDIMTAPIIVRKVSNASKAEPPLPIVTEKKTAPVVEQVAEEPASVPLEAAAEIETVAATPIPVTSGLSGAELVEEVLSDLTRLQDLKKIFETSYVEFRKRSPFDSKDFEKIQIPELRKDNAEKRNPPEVRAKPAKAPKTPKSAPTELIPEANSESLLHQIESSRKPVFPDSKKQKEQLEIIDQFITKKPTIAKGVVQKTDAADLAENSASLTDSMVSETLVEILLRQGKKDKAIEVLRKLIWKFPQKKAIFAAQIEELRK